MTKSPSLRRRVSAPAEPLTSPVRPYQKPNRLNIACTQCRRRKVRCDASLPRCRNCRLRGDQCETLDVREAEKGTAGSKDGARVNHDATAAENESIVGSTIPCHDESHPHVRKRRRTGVEPVNDDDDTTSHTTARLEEARKRASARVGPEPEEDVSWVSQAYKASAADSHCVDGDDKTGSTPDVVLNTDESASCTKFLGGSSVQSLCNFVDLHLAAIGLEPIGACFNDGMRHSEEFQIPLIAASLPLLPAHGEMDLYTSTFVRRVWPLFPVIDPTAFQADTAQLLDLQEAAAAAGGPLPSSFCTQHLSSPVQVTHLAMAYAVVCISHDELRGCTTATSARFLRAAYSLYAHLVAYPYVSSVQALVLLSLALRGQVKEGQAWQTLGQAIRVAHSVGLHKRAEAMGKSLVVVRPMAVGKSADSGARFGSAAALHCRIWWSCCALERVMQLESGRPTQLGQGSDVPVGPLLEAGVVDRFFVSWLSLTSIMGRIAQEVYANRPATLLDLLQKVQELDQALLQWEKTRHRDGSGCSAGPESDRDADSGSHLSSILLMQYNFAHITLLRLSIMFPPKVYLEQLAKHQSHLPSYARLRNGAHLCSTAARATVTEALHIADDDRLNGGGSSSSSSDGGSAGSLLWIGTSPLFLSTIVLALGILQQPLRRVARADLELLALGTELFENNLSRWMGGGGGAEGSGSPGTTAVAPFTSIGRILYDRVSSYLGLFQGRARVTVATGDYTDPGSGEGAATSLMMLADLSSASRHDIEQQQCHKQQQSELEHFLLPGAATKGHGNNGQVSDSAIQTDVEPYPSRDNPQQQQQQDNMSRVADWSLEPFEGFQFNDVWDMIGSDLLLEGHGISFA
ncbi:hypothetical protein Micbo1qcDRAFT_173732 [Microdochium bolleyi]|uniref:Zn(2)-C6 fungal-type domain-containing protein n=1 Tax=Microdochium bolleyi TaxID=196109 RepID=A0A136J5Y4_9PEZI|nr:hypothetical protein Micbo1qcDRAFT_173732 [Microdochium bolleyi]